jgi:hypothetical protein
VSAYVLVRVGSQPLDNIGGDAIEGSEVSPSPRVSLVEQCVQAWLADLQAVDRRVTASSQYPGSDSATADRPRHLAWPRLRRAVNSAPAIANPLAGSSAHHHLHGPPSDIDPDGLAGRRRVELEASPDQWDPLATRDPWRSTVVEVTSDLSPAVEIGAVVELGEGPGARGDEPAGLPDRWAPLSPEGGGRVAEGEPCEGDVPGG